MAASKNPKKGKSKKTKETGAEAKKLSAMDAAAKVLTEAGQPMSCKEMIETMAQKGYWSSPGKTPSATLYSGIIKEISTKGKESRFQKTDRGRFARS
jgi:HB1, ASXL, restriction endonuclease HTH domain